MCRWFNCLEAFSVKVHHVLLYVYRCYVPDGQGPMRKGDGLIVVYAIFFEFKWVSALFGKLFCKYVKGRCEKVIILMYRYCTASALIKIGTYLFWRLFCKYFAVYAPPCTPVFRAARQGL